jgi:hypothetical protein
MPRNPRKQHCTHPDCHAWAKRGYHLCVKHFDPAALAPESGLPSPSSDQDSLELFAAMCRSGFPQSSIPVRTGPVLTGEELQKTQPEPSPFEEYEDPDFLLRLGAAPVIQRFFARCTEMSDFAIRQMHAEVAAGRLDPLYAAEQCARLSAHLVRILAVAHSARPDPAELRARHMRAIREAERKKWEEAAPASRGPLPDDLLTPEELRQRIREEERAWEEAEEEDDDALDLDDPLPESAEPNPSPEPKYESVLKPLFRKGTLYPPGT